MLKPNAQYNIAAPNSVASRIAAYQRRRMYEFFLRELAVNDNESILDVGVTSDQSYGHSNYLEAWYPRKQLITAVGIDDASFLLKNYPGLTYVRANGMTLPFKDRSFDVVHSSAVIEHVGSSKNQIQFISECARVARRAVFVTTPNRWFPIEFHTVMPFIHWLPASLFRAVLRRISLHFFADEATLNLLSAADLQRYTKNLLNFKFRVSGVSLGGWTSNLLLIGVRIR